jgi:ribosomal protein S18 acetylase RimI-like enzyme
MPSSSAPTKPKQPPIEVRPVCAADRPGLAALIRHDGLFTEAEVTVALELVDHAIARPDNEYLVLIAESAGTEAKAAAELLGYVCYGPSPMTIGTWDLYWIVSHPTARGRGVASVLVGAMENDIRRQDGKRIRVETSGQEEYGSAHRFYQRNAYPEVARLKDYYKPGDDLVIMMKVI